MKTAQFIALFGCALMAAPASAAGLSVELTLSAADPVVAKVGDRMVFRSTIKNTDTSRRNGVTAWIDVVQTDKEHERLMDLEGRSDIVTVDHAELAAGAEFDTVWTVRLLEPGTYKAAVSVMDLEDPAPTSSRFVSFAVSPKPVVDWHRVLPVALGVPGLLATIIGIAWFRRRRWAIQ